MRLPLVALLSLPFRAPLFLPVCALLCSLAVGAEPAVGTFEIAFDGENSVWGGEEFVDACELDFGCIDLAVEVADDGDLSGTFAVELDAGGGTPVSGTLQGTARGRAAASRGRSKLSATLRASGVLTVGGRAFDTRLKIAGKLLLDGVTGTSTLQGLATVCFPRFGVCRSRRIDPMQTSLLPGDGGPWQLALDLASPDGAAIEGSATATFSDGSSSIDFVATGVHDAGKDESAILLESTTGGSKIRLKHVRVAGDALEAYALAYRVKGQKGRLEVPAP